PLPEITEYLKYTEVGVENGTREVEPISNTLTSLRTNSQSPVSQSPNPKYPLPQLAEDTGLDEDVLSRWIRAVERKGQVVLYGPPGTGKTYVAEKLAEHLIGEGDGFWELVQFHPAYAYEDFIQGIRPQSKDGDLSYPLVPGRFLGFCRKAQLRNDTCVLIIDEINRADLARVFGELMYLLEYRQREIPLAGGGTLKIPANVRLIGT
ncbi:MAG: AAA domain-containing protein, partial [Gammaproteobacteria bacterium]|nr:AAA domain-containing protein [Gammaproteobacteria bacterium]